MNQKCDIWFACIILCISCTSGNNNLTRGNEIVCDTNATEISCSITKKETKENSIEVNFFPIKNASIENALKKLDIEVSAIRKMTVHAKVRNISDEINWNIFSNFSSLRILEINFPESEIYNITEDTLDLPESVKEIAISNARIPQLSNSTNITDAIFKNGESKEAFGNCEHLNKLELMNWRVFSKEWLTNCLKLYEIRLAIVSVETIKNVLNKVESLKNLTIENCNILILGNDFLNPSLAGLKSFVFIYNQITNIHRDAFANLVQIENLDLTGNFLYNATEVRTTLMCLENLRSLILDKNRELYSCDLFKDSFLPVERLSLQHTRRIEMCFSNLTTLQYLDLRHNRISKLDLRKLPAPKNHSLLIDLRMNNITEMYGTEEEFEQITNTFIELQNITILVNNVTVDCDCNHNWVSKAFKTLVNLHVHDEVRCTNGTFITKTSPKILECDKFKCDECTCRRSWGDNTTSVDCEEASIVVVPRVKGLRELYAHRNRIERVFVEDFPHTLQYADLTNNRISSISDDVP